MNFPGFGKTERIFSKGWKIPFQSLEKSPNNWKFTLLFFQGLKDLSAIVPGFGKLSRRSL